MKRVIIYPKDIMILTGKSERYSRELFKKIKVSLNKKKGQFVSVQEFCTYTGLDYTSISAQIK